MISDLSEAIKEINSLKAIQALGNNPRLFLLLRGVLQLRRVRWCRSYWC
jgi:hypothetical protein